ncbi:MAG TPA: nucleotidyltransferase family protein, partial [Casimicrobiaceae bacterium]|nr:nucleotidyltransferase family protein [Casimicrobiaceae bacterium]
YPVEALARLRTTRGPAAIGFSRDGLLRDGYIPAERIAAYAMLDVAPDSTLRRVIEKPDAAAYARLDRSLPVSMNVWRLTSEFFRACRDVQPSPRGELELPLAVQYAIDVLGMRFSVVPVDGPVLDLSRRSDIPRVAAALARVDATP